LTCFLRFYGPPVDPALRFLQGLFERGTAADEFPFLKSHQVHQSRLGRRVVAGVLAIPRAVALLEA
jgi:hypothetical protein